MITKKIVGLLIFALSVIVVDAQLGVNTETPKATLDVQGNIGVRNKIYLGGDNTASGLLGDVGTVLVSQGAAKPPVWKVIRRPNFDPFLYTIFNNSASNTEVGVIIGNTNSGYDVNTENQTLASYGGTVIPALTKNFQIDNADNIAVLSFETIAHLQSTATNAGVDFSCGIFVDDLLKGVRVYTLNQPTSSQYTFYTYNLIAVAKTLTVGPHSAKVACKRRASVDSFTGNIGIGRMVATNLNNFMTQSSLMVETYEKPSATNVVPVYNP